MRGTGLPAALATLVYHEREQSHMRSALFGLVLCAVLVAFGFGHYMFQSADVAGLDRILGSLVFQSIWTTLIAYLFAIAPFIAVSIKIRNRAMDFFSERIEALESFVLNFDFAEYERALSPDKILTGSLITASADALSFGAPQPRAVRLSGFNISQIRESGKIKTNIDKALQTVFGENPNGIPHLFLFYFAVVSFLGGYFKAIILLAWFAIFQINFFLAFREWRAYIAARLGFTFIVTRLLETSLHRAATGESDSA